MFNPCRKEILRIRRQAVYYREENKKPLIHQHAEEKDSLKCRMKSMYLIVNEISSNNICENMERPEPRGKSKQRLLLSKLRFITRSKEYIEDALIIMFTLSLIIRMMSDEVMHAKHVRF